MNILIELPTWLGDAVMTTPAIELLCRRYPEASLTWMGSPVAVEALRAHPQTRAIHIDTSRQSRWRLWNLYRTARSLGAFDLAISFRSHLASRVFLGSLTAKHRFLYRKTGRSRHQVLRYTDFVAAATRTTADPGPLRLYHPPRRYARPTLGINPGATYGSAKRWYPDHFAAVASALADRYDIVIFGGPAETDIASEIADLLHRQGLTHVTNLAGRTTVAELCSAIGGLDLFITNDSGPMHVAVAYAVPTVAIFGPTDDRETGPWHHPLARIVRHPVDCAPCMRRTCPYPHHACMRDLSPQRVLDAIEAMDL